MAAETGKTKSILGEVVRVNCVLLENNLNGPCSLARHLFSLGLITSNEFELVKVAGSGTEHEKTRKLVDILRVKKDIILDHVLKYLLKDGTQLHIFRKLKEYAEKLDYKWQLKLVEEAKISVNQVLPEKWWPEKKTLPNSLFPRTDTVKGGQLLIETVHQQLHSTDGRTMAIVAQTQSLVGMGGVGKTTTAKWYGNKYEGHYDHVLWIGSEGTSLESSCTSLAKDLSIPVKDSDNDKKSMKKLMSEVNTKLRDCKCVYIFDNVEQYTDVRELLSTNSSHYTIITSRMLGDWGNATENGRIPTCQVNVFSEEESSQFLKKALILAEEMENFPSDEELRELGQLLGYLPLALQCAVTVIINPVLGWTFKSYLKQIKSDLKILTDKKILEEYTRPLSAALTVSLDHIGRDCGEDSSKHRELCREILYVAAYCNPERIDEEMFTHLQDVTTMQVESAVDDLIKFSLLTVNSGRKSERGQRKLNIHRLLQHVLRTSVEADPKHESKVLRLVLMCFQSDYIKHKYDAIPVWKKVLEKHEDVLQEFPQFGVHLAREVAYWGLESVGIELIELSLPRLMKIYGAVGLPIIQYNIQLAYLFMKHHAYNRADSILKELKEKVIGMEAEFREDILLHIRIASLTLWRSSESAYTKEMRKKIINEYSDLLEKRASVKLNDAVSGYTIHHWFFKRSYNWYSSNAKLAVVYNYATVLLERDEFTLAVDTICAHLDSLNCSACDIVRMEDFRRVMDHFNQDPIYRFRNQYLFKFYTWLKSREVISHWMSNLDEWDLNDLNIAEFITAYLQSLATNNKKEVLLCEIEYLFQLTGHPKMKFFLIGEFLNIWNRSLEKIEGPSSSTEALKYTWKFLRSQANSYHGGWDKEYFDALLRLREAYTYELLRNDMPNEAKAFENEVIGFFQAYISEFHSTHIEIDEYLYMYSPGLLVREFGVQTNAMQEILKLRLRTNVELLNSGIRIRGLLEDTIVALAATNQSAEIVPLMRAQLIYLKAWLLNVGEIGWREGIQLLRTHFKKWRTVSLISILHSMPEEEIFSQIRGEFSQWLKEIAP